MPPKTPADAPPAGSGDAFGSATLPPSKDAPVGGEAVAKLDAPTRIDPPKRPPPHSPTPTPTQPPVSPSQPHVVVEHGPDGGLVLRRSTGGNEVRLARDNYLGEGSSSNAYDVPGTIRPDVPGDLGQIAKLTNKGEGALDDIGRAGIKSVDQPDVIQTPELISRYPVSRSPVVPARRKGIPDKDFTDGTLSFMEKTPPSFKDLPADMKMPDGSMTPGQAISFNRGMEALNKKGFVYLDNKYDNFTFKRIGDPKDDKWTLVVIDPGGIVPMKATKGATAAENARALQRSLDAPDPSLAGFPERWRGAVHKDMLAGEFDKAVDWQRLQKETGSPYHSLRSVPPGKNPKLYEGQLIPYNPRKGISTPNLKALASQTTEKDLLAAEAALRAKIPLPPPPAPLPAPRTQPLLRRRDGPPRRRRRRSVRPARLRLRIGGTAFRRAA